MCIYIYIYMYIYIIVLGVDVGQFLLIVFVTNKEQPVHWFVPFHSLHLLGTIIIFHKVRPSKSWVVTQARS